ncbi:MAG: (Fe-S)-binding protein [Ignavibacteriaceae bacterium]|jgi:glycolate oxidase iron-sulfur subunit|nr:(Fe-S)-binding protein [Ignavibacteriaceae bacterium]
MISPKDKATLLKFLPNDDVLTQCMHCGMCLATCPTYELTKLERSSPRGRIKLIKSIAEGKLELSNLFAEEMNFCLDCQACETACPAGVQYGKMVESARVIIEHSSVGSSKINKAIKKFLLNSIVAQHSRLKLLARFLYFYQNSGIQKVLIKVLSVFPTAKKLIEIESLTPKISKVFSSEGLKEKTFPENPAKYKIAFSTGCIMDVAFSDINFDTIEVLQKNQCEIITPKKQVCCGSLHAHNGEIEKAKELAKKNLDVFSEFEYDFLISNSAGCGAFMKEYVHLFADDPQYAQKAKMFSQRVKDISEFLANFGPNNQMHSLEETVTYHDACHLCHSQKITEEPRKLLQQIPGLNLIPLEESTWCCGSAGIYNVTRHDDAEKILERKMKNLKDTGADVVVAGNPGCIGQLKYGIKKYGLKMEVLHTISLVKKSMENNI